MPTSRGTAHNDLARELCPGPGESGYPLPDPIRSFIEVLTFADAEAIELMIGEFVADVGPLPVWARNLAYRLACLQRPEDAALLKAAGIDLYMHGPDWDGSRSHCSVVPMNSRAGRSPDKSAGALRNCPG